MHSALLRTIVADHDDIPAFKASFFVLSLLSAALLNFGAFGLLIVAHMGLDIVKYREVHGYSWSITMRGVVRESIMDMTLLIMGLVITIFMDPSLHLVTAAMHANSVFLRAVAITLSKVIVLMRFATVLVHPYKHLRMTKTALRKEWLFGERSFAALFILLIVLLIAAPWVMSFSDHVYQELLLRAVVPWRI